MKLHKVKYNRNEYRKEYLRSEEWIKFRKTIIGDGIGCRCCDGRASDVHHMIYRNIVDIKVTDVIPVCRQCHDTIHQAIKDDYIPMKDTSSMSGERLKRFLKYVTKLTININHDKRYERVKEWLKTKHPLSEGEVRHIVNYTQTKSINLLNRIRGILKQHVTLNQLLTLKITGRTLRKVRNHIRASSKYNSYTKRKRHTGGKIKRFNQYHETKRESRDLSLYPL